MNRNEFAVYQSASTAGDLAELVLRCSERFYRSAKLIGYRTDEIDILENLSLWKAMEVSALVPPWQALCNRYLREVYSPQMQLWPDMRYEPNGLWHVFVHAIFIPTLVKRDEFVRASLCAFGLLPSKARQSAIQHVGEQFAAFSLSDLQGSQFGETVRRSWIYKHEKERYW